MDAESDQPSARETGKHKHIMTVSITDQAYCTNLLGQFFFFFLPATVKVVLFFTLLCRFSLFMLPRSKGASKFIISGIF
jgi:putative effector of murein hydrolase LrgA (UPF0299 family)